ncbi:MAG: hypothetical protein RLZZ494_629 [Pseudomonadota bacterium]|jgi:methyl-accepting chemotaxis protein
MGMIKWLRAKAARARRHGDSAAKAVETTASELGAGSTLNPHDHEDDLPDGEAQAGGLDFVAAIRAHQAWKGRLLGYVQGQSTETFDAAEVARDDVCVLGHWLHGPGCQVLEDPALLPELKAAHAQFHQLAGQIVQAMQAGDVAAAQHLMATDYHRVSVRMQGKLAELFLIAAPPESTSATA